MRIALIAGRDPTISTDTDGGSVFVEYLIKHLHKTDSTLDIFIPKGLIGANFSKNRILLQENKKVNEGSKIVYFPVPPNFPKQLY